MRHPYEPQRTHWGTKLAMGTLLLAVLAGMIMVILPMMQSTPDIAKAYREHQNREGLGKTLPSSPAKGAPHQ